MHAEITQAIEDYCELHSKPENSTLYQLNRETNLRVLRPRMLSGNLQGKFLIFISKIMKPKAILEIGTYTGYSAICLAEGLSKEGILHTIEIDEELEEIITKYVGKSAKKEQIKVHIGDALQVIPTLQEEWDLVFIDADKKDYIAYYEAILPHLRKGGIIMADNVLWSGKVIQDIKSNDKDTQALMKFNEYVLKDERVDNFLLPFRDGIMFMEKL